MQRTIQIAPSILAADFARLGEEVAGVESQADLIHIDLMDGHFVPNLAVGIPVIASLRSVTSVPFDCHMMVTNAHAYVEPLAEAGADLITVHVEVYPEPSEVAGRVRDAGMRFGLVLNPPTPVEAVEPYLEACDLVLVMSVHPGFGGQSFIDGVLVKVERLRKIIDSQGLATDIEIDGGIDPSTAARAAAAGANVLVAGTAIFRASDPVAAAEQIREAASGAR